MKKVSLDFLIVFLCVAFINIGFFTIIIDEVLIVICFLATCVSCL